MIRFAVTMQLPPEPEGQLIHDREYSVKAYRIAADMLVLRGVVHDQKPPGVYFEDDPDPLSVHHMVVDLTVRFPTMEIVAVEVTMNVTPHLGCSAIEPDYQQLVGLSIARGFSRSVKDLLGGPRGCTHIGALLQAMAPIAIQSSWSMRALNSDTSTSESPSKEASMAQALTFNLNTCHIWAEDGAQVQVVRDGGELEIPVWAVDRAVQLGRTPEEWRGVRSDS